MRLNVPVVPHFPIVDINQICEDVFFEPRPFPGNDQFFIGCIRGTGVILQCYENETFDNNLLKCIRNDEITTLPTVTTTTTEPPDLNGLCRGRDFDFVAHPSDCAKVIFCFREDAILRHCEEGTIFDLVNQE